MGLEQISYIKLRCSKLESFTQEVNTHSIPIFFLNCCLMYSGGGFGMGSRSATTSPTGSVHSTPTHQNKPNTLDPFADIGNLGGSLGGLTTTRNFPNSFFTF